MDKDINGMKLKEFIKEFYIIHKKIEFGGCLQWKDGEAFKEWLEEIDEDLKTIFDEDELENIYLVKRHSTKKLNNHQIEKIKISKESYRSIAKEFGVSAATISKIKNNKY